MLKPGDPCPCCGQPIKTTDPEILALLTYIKDVGINQRAVSGFLNPGAGGGNDDTVMQ